MSATDRTRVRRHPERGAYEREPIDAILDEALICHVGFVVDGQPFVIPTIHARIGDVLYLHGSPASRMLRTLRDGVDVCVTATLLDGIVLARSVYNHSMNYRSAVVLGRAREVTDAAEKLRALEAVVEHMVPGRWSDARQPTQGELDGTTVLALALDEASAKVRSGPSNDFDRDTELPVWAGVVPLRLAAGGAEAGTGRGQPRRTRSVCPCRRICVTELLAFLGVSALVIVTPGQDTALTIRNTLLGGRAAGVCTALGVSAGQATWTVCTAFGVGALLVASEPAFLALKLAGAAYLIYLGVQALLHRGKA